MSDEALILRNDRERTVSFTQTALAIKSAALERSALIARVKTAEDQAQAVEATAGLKRVHADAEKARKACKDPVIKFGRDIDAAHESFTKDINTELLRLSTLVANFQMLERERLMAEQQMENERLAKLERERAAEVAKATSLAQIDDIREQYAERVRLESPPPKPVAKAAGQSVMDDWDVEVFDIWLLARTHPGCVKIEPRVSEIKGLLKAGVREVAGVRAKPILRNVVRASKDVPAIDV